MKELLFVAYHVVTVDRPFDSHREYLLELLGFEDRPVDIAGPLGRDGEANIVKAVIGWLAASTLKTSSLSERGF